MRSVVHTRAGSPADVIEVIARPAPPAPEALSELVTTDAANAVHVPFDVDDEVASLMLVNSITAREVLRALFKSAGTFAVDDILGAVEAAQRPGKRGTPLVLMSSGAMEASRV